MSLKCDEPLSNFAYNLNLRRYTTGRNLGPEGAALVNSVVLGEGARTLQCRNAQVTVNNTVATCELGAGTGLGYKVRRCRLTRRNPC